jgi:hypothetical protein
LLQSLTAANHSHLKHEEGTPHTSKEFAAMYDVFISYIHEDEEAARGLYDFLRAKLKEITVRTAPNIFLSSEQLGDNWPQTIQEAL